MKILKLFSTQPIEEYIKKTTDLIGKRKFQRLPANVPVLYSFPDQGEKENFKQASTLDVSVGGLAIEIIKPPDEIKNRFLVMNNNIIMQIDIPSEEEMIKFTGVIRWIRNIESKRKPKTLVGVEYVHIGINDKINILSYALKINRRKNFIKLSLIVLSILIIATSVWGIRTTISKQKVEKELKISEDLRSRLEIDIKELSELKTKIDKELVRQRYKIKETNEKLAAFKNISEELQERIYVYTIISDQDVVFLTSKSNTNILDDENYKKARIEMTNNRCAEAKTYFQLAVDKNPDSPIGYSGLIRAYNCLKDYKKSKEIFDIYLKFQKKELESK